MFNIMKTIAAIILCLLLNLSHYQAVCLAQTVQENVYKQDYLQACKLIANNYIYLEAKLGITGDTFYKQSVDYADTVEWTQGKVQFVREIRKLRSRFPDGHFNWRLPPELFLREDNYFLGFVMTVGKNNHVYVGKVYDSFTGELTAGDEILTYNGADIQTVLAEFGKLIPQSTPWASREVAARLLTAEFKYQPLREQLEPVNVEYKTADGQIRIATLAWKPAVFTLNLEKFENDFAINHSANQFILLNQNGFPSLEDIPGDVRYIHPDLPYYIRRMGGKIIAVLHPRHMSNWDKEDLDATFAKMLQARPDFIVIDLYDSVGGHMNRIQYLFRILGMKDISGYCDEIDVSTGVREGERLDRYQASAGEIEPIWKGKTILRVNSICGSADDYFARWFQLQNRGMIAGLPTAGRGGGYDDFVLKNTKTKIMFPFEDTILDGDTKHLEGNGVFPDYLTDESMERILENVIKKEQK